MTNDDISNNIVRPVNLLAQLKPVSDIVITGS